jgi:ketosteroid isomerase-like protein
MNGEDAVRELWRLFDEGRFDEVRPLLADDFSADWPQTRERIIGPDNFIALNATYPGRWRCTLLHRHAAGDAVISEVEIGDGATTLYAVSVFTLRDGRIAHAREYFGDAGEPPYDRSQWTERY